MGTSFGTWFDESVNPKPRVLCCLRCFLCLAMANVSPSPAFTLNVWRYSVKKGDPMWGSRGARLWRSLERIEKGSRGNQEPRWQALGACVQNLRSGKAEISNVALRSLPSSGKPVDGCERRYSRFAILVWKFQVPVILEWHAVEFRNTISCGRVMWKSAE
jgi:hypothetical protein